MGLTLYIQLSNVIGFPFVSTGGSCLSHTVVSPDFCCQISLYNLTYYNNWISQIMLKPDRFSCSQKIWLKQDPPCKNVFLPSQVELE